MSPQPLQKPRVLQVVLSLGPGGTERLVVELVRRLRNDVEPAVCCLDAAGLWGEELRREGVPLRALERRPGFRPGLARDIAAFAREQGATVLHCHQYSAFVYGALARLFAPRLRVLFTEHGRLSDAPPSTKRRRANQVLRWLPERSFTVSRELKDHLVAEGFPAARVEVIYNGIDVGPVPDAATRCAVRAALGLPDDRLVIVTVARLDPVKDFATLIRGVALASAARPVTLLIVGDGPERAGLEAVARDTAAGDTVRFLGHRDDARQLLAGGDIFVNSSVSEGISLTILEAMAARLPVVATAVGGTPEILDDSCARLVPPRDPQALAGAIATLGADQPLARRLADAGRARVQDRFTLDRMIAEYRAAYYAVVN